MLTKRSLILACSVTALLLPLGTAHAARDFGLGVESDAVRNGEEQSIQVDSHNTRAKISNHHTVSKGVGPARQQGHRISGAGISLVGLPQPLVSKVADIKNHCPGFHVVSAFRPGARVAGSGRISLHALHKAVDIAGPHYHCAYSRLHGWPGGYSIDAWRVRHIHMSWAPHGREWHARFNHWHGGSGNRYARLYRYKHTVASRTAFP